MLRAIVSISQRGKLPQALLSVRGLDYSILEQIKLRHSHLLSRPIVRCFASGDDKIKGGIIGNMGSTTNIGNPTAQAQTAAMGTDTTRDNSFGKQSDYSGNKTGTITSQIHATPTMTECGQIGTDEAAARAKKLQQKKDATNDATKDVGKSAQSGPGNNFSDDAVKQLQNAAANLPSKEQVEKFLFRVVAFLYDISYLMINWTIRFVNQNIIQNATVRHYWKRFHEKMEQAKKD